MDFHALPRRDLQALCKRNGVRANMTNAAMADALAALPAVDGVDEYVKQPVSVAAPEVEAAPEEEKLGSPLRRGRRVAVKAAQPLRADDNKEDGKGEAKRESTKQDAPAIGAERRGTSRRARAAPAAATSVAEPAAKAVVAEDKPEVPKGSDLKKDEKAAPAPVVSTRQDAPAIGAERRGASRRARAAHAAVTSVAEPAAKAVVAEKDKPEEPKGNDLKQDANQMAVAAPVVGRRGASRRARPAPVVVTPAAEFAGTGTAEEQIGEKQGSPVPRGRRVIVKSPQPIRQEGGEGDDEDLKQDESKDDAPALGVGRRGASRRARTAPAGKVIAEEEEASIPRGRRVMVKSPEVICLDDSDEINEDNKPKVEEEVEPELLGDRRVANRRARPAPVEAPATRRRAAASRTEAEGVPVEAAPVRSTRQRKPTMKAAAAMAEGRLPRRATRRVAAINTASQKEEEKEEQQGAIPDAEAVPAPVCSGGCDDAEDVDENAVPQNEEENEVVSQPKDGVKEVVVNDDEMLMEEAPEEEPIVTDQEHSDESALQENNFDGEQCAAPFPSQDDSPIFGLVSTTVVQVVEEDEYARPGDGLRPLDKGIGEEIHHAGEDMEMVPITEVPLVSMKPSESRDGGVFTSDADHVMEMENFSELLNGTDETSEVSSEDGLIRQEGDVVGVEVLPDTVDGAVLDCSFKISQVAEEEVKEVEVTDEMPPCSAALDKNGEKTTFCTNVASADDLGEVSVADDEVVEEEKVPLVNEDMPQSTDVVDEEDHFETEIQADEQEKMVTAENEMKTEGEVVVEEQASVITEDMPHSPSLVDEVDEEDHFETEIQADEQEKMVTAENETETEGGFVVEEKASVITEDMPHSPTLVDEFDEEDHFETEIQADEQEKMVTAENETETEGEVVVEEKASVITEDMPHSPTLVDEFDEEDHFETEIQADEQEKMVPAENEQGTEDEVVKEEGVLITDDMKQCTLPVDEVVVDGNFKTDFVHDDEQKEKLTTDQMPELAMKDGEVADEETIVVITEDMEMPQSTGTVDECVEEDHFKIDFAHANEQNIKIVCDKVPDVVGTEEADGLKENAFTGTLPQELDIVGGSSGHMTSALLEDGTKFLSKSIVAVETVVSRAQEADTSVCKNSIEMTTSEPVVLQVEKGGKVPKKSMDANKLSMRQLKAKIKEKLIAKKNKEAKRVALARVDENVCRSNANGQENLNLQQY